MTRAISAIVPAVASLLLCGASQPTPMIEADVLWQRAVRAKGGSEALSRVRSLLLIEETKARRVVAASLVVPGLGMWAWGPERPSGAGPPSSWATRFDKKSSCGVTQGMSPTFWDHPIASLESRAIHLSLAYLLHVDDAPPRFTGVSVARVGRRVVDRVGLLVQNSAAAVFSTERRGCQSRSIWSGHRRRVWICTTTLLSTGFSYPNGSSFTHLMGNHSSCASGCWST